jgi:TRAP-type transport system small permease protein
MLTEKSFYKYLDVIIEVLFLLIFIITFLNIASRVLTGKSWNWTGELSRYLFIWASFITGSLAIKKNEHLGVGDDLIRKIPEKYRIIIDFMGSLFAIVFSMILIIYGFKTSLLLMLKKTPFLSLPMGYINSIIAISGVLFIFNIVLDMIKGKK